MHSEQHSLHPDFASTSHILHSIWKSVPVNDNYGRKENGIREIKISVIKDPKIKATDQKGGKKILLRNQAEELSSLCMESMLVSEPA